MTLAELRERCAKKRHKLKHNPPSWSTGHFRGQAHALSEIIHWIDNATKLMPLTGETTMDTSKQNSHLYHQNVEDPYFRIGQLEGAIKGALPYFEALLELVDHQIPPTVN